MLSSSGGSAELTPDLQLSDVTVRYGKVVAVDAFNLSVAHGELVVLLGASGCGKSTILNSVAGTIAPSSGAITVGGKVVFDGARRLELTPDKRDLGMVFQSYALWPHLTVARNVAYPLERRRMARADIDARVAKVLKDVQCGHLGDRYPSELSGGQQQRVALARAIVAAPRSILFDEPLSNLDAALRRDLREQIKELQRSLGFTGLYVTHDQEEALAVADRVLVLGARGAIEEIGEPQTVYRNPSTAFGAHFFGANVIAGELVSGGTGPQRVRTRFGEFDGRPCGGLACEGEVSVAIYPERIAVEPAADSPVIVESLSFAGKRWECVVRHRDDPDLRVRLFREDLGAAISRGQPVRLTADRDWVFVHGRHTVDGQHR